MRVGVNPSSQNWASNGVHEGRVQSILAYKLAAELQRRGHVTLVTDSAHDLRAEMRAMNAFGPAQAISLHNDGTSRCPYGFMVIWQDDDDKPQRDRIVRELRRAFPGERVVTSKRTNLYVLKTDSWPFCLVEVHNADCPFEARRLLSPVFQDKIARVLATALVGPGVYDLRFGRRALKTIQADVRKLEWIYGKTYTKTGTAFRFPRSKVQIVKAGTYRGATVYRALIGGYSKTYVRRMERIVEGDLGYTNGQALVVPHS